MQLVLDVYHARYYSNFVDPMKDAGNLTIQ